MAALKTNKWYVRYCEEVATGALELPPYQQQPGGAIQIEYGEVFCRVEDCSNARKKYTATNNLVTHLKSHDGVQVPLENKGGRVAQKVIDQAVSDRYSVWYKGLFAAPGPSPAGPALPSPAAPHPAAGPSPGPSTQLEPRRATRHSASQDIQPVQLEEDDNIQDVSSDENEEQEEDQEDQESEGLSNAAESLPPLPLKRDGTVHILDMRKQVVTMGAKVPCGACKVYKNCCKDDEECENFALFAPR